MTDDELKAIEENFPPRSLTRGELKTLRKAGLNLSCLKPDNAEDAFDAVLETVYGEQVEAIDQYENMASMHLFERIMERTFGVPGGKKNSSTPGKANARQ